MTSYSSTLVQTAGVQRVRQFMDQALDTMHGLEFRFTVARYKSLKAAKERATSLQNQVSSIRARARNTAQVRANRKNNEFTGEQIPGQYDKLVCFKRLLPDESGYIVVIGPATAQEDDFEIINLDTGQELKRDDPRVKRRDLLGAYFIERAFNEAVRPPYLTYEQERELYDLDPTYFTNMYEAADVPLPKWLTGLQALANDGPAFDLADTPMDAFGVDEGAEALDTPADGE